MREGICMLDHLIRWHADPIMPHWKSPIAPWKLVKAIGRNYLYTRTVIPTIDGTDSDGDSLDGLR